MLHTKAYINEAKRTPSKINGQKMTLNHIIFKLQEIKIKKSPEQGQRRQILIYSAAKIRITFDSYRTM